jgi:site-specific recombinase XerD
MKLFISYSRVDKPTCEEIIERLTAHDVWVDQKLHGSEKWWDKIKQQLEWCDGFMYLLSNESVSSEYCIKEYEKAVELGKQIIPVIIRARTQIPSTLESLNNIQQVNYTERTINSVTDLLNSVLIAERAVNQNTKKSNQKPSLLNRSSLPFNYAYILEKQQNLSELTVNTYFRWLENFLVTVASFEPSHGKQQRKKRMENLPIGLLVDNLNIVHIRAWLDTVLASRDNPVGALQAKAAIKHLINQMIERDYLDPIILQEIDAISIPKHTANYLARRNLSLKEIKLLISTSVEMATSDNQARRNKLLMLLFSYLLMKPHDVAKLTWEQTDVNSSAQTLSLYKPDAHLTIQAPALAYSAYKEWLDCFEMPIEPDFNLTPIIRAIMKSGNITSNGMSARGVLQIVAQAASHANLGEVTPLDIRQSVAQIMVREKIFPIDIVSRLFGHARGKAATQLFDKTQAKSVGEVIYVPDFLS